MNKKFTIFIMVFIICLALVNVVYATEITNDSNLTNPNNDQINSINNDSSSGDVQINLENLTIDFHNESEVVSDSNPKSSFDMNLETSNNSITPSTYDNGLFRSVVGDIYVDGTNGFDTNDGLSWSTAVKTIGQAISLIDATHKIIVIANGTYEENSLTLTKNATIIANETRGVIINGTGQRVFIISSNVTLDGLILVDGNTAVNGGLIYINSRNSLSAYDCSFSSGFQTVVRNGGAIFANSYVNQTLVNCIFENSSARTAMQVYAGRYNNLIIDNCTFANSKGDGANLAGGCIYLVDSSFGIVKNSLFMNNTGANTGAGIKAHSNITVINSTFLNNSAYSGGAIYVNNGLTLNLTNSTFANNNAIGSAGKGGDIYILGNLYVSNSNFTNAHSQGYAGSIFAGANLDHNIDIDNCNFINCSAKGYITYSSNLAGAGVLYLKGYTTIKDSQFIDNFVENYNGGAICTTEDNVLNIIDCNFTHNYVKDLVFKYEEYQGYGGAISADPGSNLNISGSNFVNNSAFKGGAISVRSQTAGSTTTLLSNVSLNNCYFEGNEAIYDSKDNISGSGGVLYSTGDIKIVNCTTINNSANNGGSIYAGALSDILVNNTNFINNVANATSNGTGGAIYSDVNSSTNVFSSNFTNNTAAFKGGAIFTQHYGSTNTYYSTFVNNSAFNGGAIYSGKDSEFADINSSFLGNNAINDAGAIYVNGTVSCNSSILINNTAGTDAGAIYCDVSGDGVFYNMNVINNTALVNGGAIYSIGDLIITNSEFMCNNVTNGNGGTIFLLNGSANITDSNFTGSTAYNGGLIYSENSNLYMNIQDTMNNYAFNAGGFLYNKNSTAIIITSNVFNNTAGVYGGFAVNENGNLTVHNTTIINNTAKYGGFLYSNGTDSINTFDQSVIFDNNVTSGGHGTDIYLNETSLDNVNFDQNWWGVNYPDNDQYYWTNWTNRISTENVTGTVPINTWITLNNSLIITGINQVTLNTTMYITNINGDNLGAFTRYRPTDLNITDFNNVTENSTSTFVEDGSVSFISGVNPVDLYGYSTVDYQTVNDTVYQSVLKSNDTDVYVGNRDENFTLKGNLSYTNNTSISGELKINITDINGVVKNYNVTVNDGYFELNLTLNGGPHDIVYYYEGTEKIWPSNLNGTIYVIYNTVVVIPSVNGTPGETVNFTVNVTDEYGDPVVNGSVIVSLPDGVSVNLTVSNGVASGNWTIPVGFKPGSYNVTANYTGNDYYNPSINSSIWTVLNVDTVVVIPSVNGTPGETVNFTVNVTDEYGDPVVNGSVIVSLPDGVSVNLTVSNGVASGNWTIPVGFKPGSYNVTANYTGNDYYNPSINSSIWTVLKVDTVVVIPSVNGTPGETVNFTVNVTDEYGDPVVNGSVIVSLPDGVSVNLTVSNGVASGNWTIPVGFKPGSYNVTANYTGNDYYNPSINSSIWTVLKVDTVVVIPSVNGTPGETVNFTVNVTDEYGDPVVNGSVIVSLPDGVSVNLTVSNGVASGNWTIPVGFKPGSYNVTANYTGNDYYNPSINSSIWTVLKVDTVVVIPSVNGTPGETVNFTVNVTDEYGDPVVNGSVIVSLPDGVSVNLTVSNGVASGNWTIPVGFKPGSYNVTANYTGNDYYNPSINSSIWTVLKVDTVVVIPSVNGTPGETVNFTVNVTDEYGDPVVNGSVIVSLPDGVSVNLTVSNGVASGNWTIPVGFKPGSYNVTANYTGNDYYNPSINSSIWTVLKVDTVVVIPSVNGTPGETVNFTVNVTDEYGDPVVNGSVIVSLPDGVSVNLTVSNGVASGNWTIPVGFKPGSYNVTANYTGNDYYNPSINSSIWTVLKVDTVVVIPSVNGTPGETVNFTVNVTDEYGDPVVNGSVIVSLPDGVSVNLTVSNGVASGNWTIPVGFKPGSYNVTANYTGNDYYNPSINSSIWTVLKVDTVVVIPSVNGTPGETVNFTVNVTDEYGDPVVNGSVIVSLPDGVSVNLTVSNGVASGNWTIPVGFKPGSYNVTANYTGNDYYNPSINSSIWTVLKVDTVVVIPSVNGTPGETVNFTVNVTDEYGDPVVNGSVIVSLPDGVSVNLTVSNGVASGNWTIPVGFKPGSYNVTANYTGNDYYNPSINSSIWTVLKVDTVVVIPSVNGTPGETVNFTVNVTDEYGDPVVNGSVIVSLPDGVSVNLTVSNGVASGNWTIPVGFKPGSYNVTANYTGNDYYNPSINSSIWTVLKVDTVVVIPSVNGTPGETVNFTVNVTDEYGDPVVNGSVIVSLPDGVSVNLTVSNGVASGNWTIPVGFKPGSYNVTANYTGNDYYNPSINSSIWTVLKVDTVVVIPSVNGTPGETVNFTVNVTDESGNPVLSGNVTLVLPDGTNITVPVVNGQANFTLTLPSVGDYNFTVLYNGDEIYSPCNGSGVIHVKVSPKPKPGPDPKPVPRPDPIINDNVDSVDNKHITSGVLMQNTGNPILILLLALLVIPFIYKRKF